MSRKVYSIFFIVLSFVKFSVAQQHTSGEIIAWLHANASPEKICNELSNIDSKKTFLQVENILSKELHICLFKFDVSVDENKMLNLFRKNEMVALAQFNFYTEERGIPNDSLFPQQWNLNNTGQNSGSPDADIDAPEAWDSAIGGLTVQGDTIVVAIVDCGFDLQHNDLDYWKNYGEIPNDSIDNDNNGYIDDYDGWNGNGTNVITLCSHGTHVAGIAGARGNNSIGISGVSQHVKIMSVQNGNGLDAGAIGAYSYVYAMRKLYNQTNGLQGAFVVSTNTSFGINLGQPVDHPVWCAMYDSLGSVGVLSAGAGPNLNLDIDAQGDIPTACPSDWMIAVTNTNNIDAKYSSAGYGLLNMDLGAPGTNILSTIPNNNYGVNTGTSMATPHVAGAVALLWSYACDHIISYYKSNPAAGANAMKNVILQNVDTLPSLTGITVSGGRLNVLKSINALSDQCMSFSTNDLGHTNSISVFPNPANDSYQILSTENLNGVVVEISDVSARKISSEEMNLLIGQPAIMQTNSLSSGTYLLTLYSAGKIRHHQLMSIIH